MPGDITLEELRAQPFYVGQILKIGKLEQKPARLVPLKSLLEELPFVGAGSLGRILSVLGYDQVYSSLLSALRVAFPQDDGRHGDVVLVEPYSIHRERTWQLVCLAEVLDRGRRCIILCPDGESARRAADRFQQIVKQADIEYAVKVLTVLDRADFAGFLTSIPLIVLLTPETLWQLLRDPKLGEAKEILLSALGRVAVPCMDEWPAALASQSAFLLRELQLRCAERGIFPVLAATFSPCLNAAEFARRLWGRPLPGENIVEEDSVECPAIDLIFYGGGFVRDAREPRKWIRQPLRQVAESLMKWLAGEHTGAPTGNIELHYVLDVSGSMSEALPVVLRAVMRDLEAKQAAGLLKRGDRIKLTTFTTVASEVFRGEFDDTCTSGFRAALDGLAASDGTNVAAGLKSALESALRDECATAVVILLSDGESPLATEERRELLDLARRLQSNGRRLRLLYVVLDFDPPAVTRNLIHAMGGMIVNHSLDTLERERELDLEITVPKTIVSYSGPQGLPSEVLQAFRGGRRRVVFTRSPAQMEIDPKDVAAVVVSGRFGSRRELLQEVRHLGREYLPVFVLCEAEAYTQLILNDYVEADALRLMAPIHPDNPRVMAKRLADVLMAEREMEIRRFRYLMEGSPAFGELERAVGLARDAGESMAGSPEPDTSSEALPEGFRLVRRGRDRFVVLSSGQAEREKPSPPLDTFSGTRRAFEGERITGFADAGIAPLALHKGRVIDGSTTSAEVEDYVAGGTVRLVARSRHRYRPVLEGVNISQCLLLNTLTIHGFGRLEHKQVTFAGNVVAVDRFLEGNLENVSERITPQAAARLTVGTEALRWEPQGATPEVMAGLANSIRFTLRLLLRCSEDLVFVLPEPAGEGGAIWIMDLAEGGNGISSYLYRHHELLRELLVVGARIAMDCPCEGGLAGATTQDMKIELDTGCPRCTRFMGPAVLGQGGDLFAPASFSKKKLLEWLISASILDASARPVLQEKYEGIDQLARVTRNQGWRRGLIPLVRKILADRLGIEIDGDQVASADWLPEGEERWLGLYEGDRNRILLKKNMPEWMALDVVAHEFFHNLQYRSAGLFDHSRLGPSAEPKPPFDGKLFLEGAAQWGESHVLDTMAIRTSLDLTNLREGDEYGDGFQLMKCLEEDFGGVRAVRVFLSTGDISQATAGRIRDLDSLYLEMGIVR